MLINFLKNKHGSMTLHLFSFRTMIILLILILEIFFFIINVNEIERNATYAMESALKEFKVTEVNDIVINKTAAVNTFTYYFRENLKLDAGLTALSDNKWIDGTVTVTAFEIYDDETSSYPYTVHGKNFYHPTIHLTFEAKTKSVVAKIFNLPISYNKIYHIDESNEGI